MIPAARPGFGRADAVTAETLAGLPDQMRAEGLRLLIEMGESLPAIGRRTGLSRLEIMRLVEAPLAPYRRADAPGEG